MNQLYTHAMVVKPGSVVTIFDGRFQRVNIVRPRLAPGGGMWYSYCNRNLSNGQFLGRRS